MIYLILITFTVILVLYKIFVIRIPSNFPPGPRLKIPIIETTLEEAYRLFIEQDEIEKHKDYSKRYGNTYSLMVGGERLIYMSDYETIKDAFNQDSTNFRPTGSEDFRRGYAEFKGGDGFTGIVDSHGPVWREQRRFSIHQLKNFGFGKATMEAQVLQEIQEFTTDLNKKINQNEEIDFGVSFNLSVMNVLSRIISGTRFDINNEADKQKFVDISKIFEFLGGFKVFIAFGLPFSLRNYNPYFKMVINLVNSMYDMIQSEKEKHEKTYDEDYMRDYMDCYLREMKRTTDAGDINSSFYGEQGNIHLKASILDLYLAGSETSSTTLLFSLMYMVNFPKVQEKVQAELDKVVGHRRLPSIKDKLELPYVEATIAEIQRCSQVAHQSVLHSNQMESIEIGGYTIPAGCILVSNLAAVMLDPVNFENPEIFEPERYICPNTGVFKPHPLLVPFGIGKRECPGKSLAKLELFLFFATLLHQYSFSPAKEGAPDLNKVSYPLTRTPKPFKVKVTRRILTT